jgi:hypothetical protein
VTKRLNRLLLAVLSVVFVALAAPIPTSALDANAAHARHELSVKKPAAAAPSRNHITSDTGSQVLGPVDWPAMFRQIAEEHPVVRDLVKACNGDEGCIVAVIIKRDDMRERWKMSYLALEVFNEFVFPQLEKWSDEESQRALEDGDKEFARLHALVKTDIQAAILSLKKLTAEHLRKLKEGDESKR